MKKKEHIVPGYNMLQRYVLRPWRQRHFSEIAMASALLVSKRSPTIHSVVSTLVDSC